ncbi:DUF2061 domain-containing protein [uncultured Roseibium sp.]|uniref:DUF2061 domain-containing protein n=1 Tax=uncultured Roseibium sp. TaxID=1936171 RepID=UPI002596B3C0|nr:DUF2061 domain-containing protein [uncultured Roseibium sp.]
MNTSIGVMDTTKRTFLKALTWQLLGLITMTALSYPHTGSLYSALALASSASASGFLAFFVHEKVWNKVPWGRAVQTEKAPH